VFDGMLLRVTAAGTALPAVRSHCAVWSPHDSLTGSPRVAGSKGHAPRATAVAAWSALARARRRRRGGGAGAGTPFRSGGRATCTRRRALGCACAEG
jgi:hypothetical protein